MRRFGTIAGLEKLARREAAKLAFLISIVPGDAWTVSVFGFLKYSEISV